MIKNTEIIANYVPQRKNGHEECEKEWNLEKKMAKFIFCSPIMITLTDGVQT